ncbi:MAG: superoxide dismutase [Chloroflexota bacterium]|nr:superoxide dismutase [Chloroflexota bacterium]
MTRPRARLALVALAGLLPLAALSPSAAAQDATPVATPTETGRLFPLPGEAVFPEGVAYQEETGDFFVGSTTDGTIYRGNVETGAVEVFVEGAPGGAAVGLEVDDEGRLYVAGGTTGLVSVYDTGTGALLAEFSNGLAPNTFLNDVAVSAAGDAYVTDSFNPFLSVVLAASVVPGSALEEGAATPGTGAPVGPLAPALDLSAFGFQLGEGFNANGIVATPDGRYLLVAQTNTGLLYRVELAAEEAIQVDLGGASLPGDGLLLDGQTLYAVTGNEISVVELAEDYAAGSVVGSFTDPSFSSPTTIARYDGCLLVVNSQFANQGGTPDLPFTISAVPIPVLGAAATPGAATPVAAAAVGTPIAGRC